jgi:serine/threonine-protein kinase
VVDLLQRLRNALADRYAISHMAGAGGIATVFQATDLKQDRHVAIKVLRPDLAAAIGAERFLHEIRLTANLQHPHIVPLFDSGDADPLLYYVMPWVEGESLQERLARERRLPVEEAIRITTEIAHALGHAHAHGVIHRDVKPGNILLSGGQALLADFGIARAVLDAGGEKLTATGLVLGTPSYMSPEQAAGGDAIDGRSDIYSLGCVLYEMLSGDPPFVGSSAQAIVARKFAEPAPTLRTVRDTVPQALERVIQKALARVPADRYATAVAFAQALADPARVAQPPMLRWRTRAGIVIGLSVAIAVSAILALRLGSNRHAGLDPRRVFLAPFENQTGDASLNNVGEVSVDWLIRELQSTELVQVIDEGALVATESDSRPGRDASLARNARAGTMVSVAYYRLADSLGFRVRITETATGARLYTSHPITSPVVSPLAGLDELSRDLVGAVVTLVAPGVEWHADAKRPPSLVPTRSSWPGWLCSRAWTLMVPSNTGSRPRALIRPLSLHCSLRQASCWSRGKMRGPTP